MRSFETIFDDSFLKSYQEGVMSYEYKGIRCLKSPIDIAIYFRLIWDLQPKTIIEIGSKFGGSAMLLADICAMYDFETRIYSIDVKPPNKKYRNVSFLKGNVNALGLQFDESFLTKLPRPLLVIEDSAHTYEGCLSALNFFSNVLLKGEYLIIEDGILEEMGWADRYGGGPNKAIEDYFVKHPSTYLLDQTYCDMFGKNATYNPNGYLKKL